MITLLDIMISYNAEQGLPIIDESLLKQSALATILPFQMTNNGRNHMWRKFTKEPTPTHGGINSGNTTQQAEWVEETTAVDELEIVQGYSKKAIAESQFDIFAEDEPVFKNSLVKSALRGLYRGSEESDSIKFLGLKQIAERDSLVRTVTGGTTTNKNVLFAIKVSANHMFGIYNPYSLDTVSGGNISSIVGSHPYNTANGSFLATAVGGGSVESTGMAHAIQYGVVSKTTNYVSMLHGIDSTHKPSVADVKAILQNVKHRLGGQIYLIGNLETLGYIDELKNSVLEMSPNDADYKTLVTLFDGIQVLPDELLTAQY
jgi:hypothetical protein